ncbi:ATP-dependent RNA helicase dbp7 [Cladophialophora chaetospira]|uniref:ATP-dependent RNA helicase n=1 Tax=Cladophialophora chaetospira TaxID=386627 RepID=A0AA39CDN4_9EURO|nr:ATP-dependent RNA helicase dbp7 [Cladophialophora chaetospira]
MADDGMFLNFAVDENAPPAANASKRFKGGSWRDRLKAKRTAQRAGTSREERKKTDDPNSVPISQRRSEGSRQKPAQAGNKEQEADFPDPRPVKRRRKNAYVPDTGAVAGGSQRRNEQRPIQSGPREVISSLFTYNPKPATATEDIQTNAEDKPTAPSNAPLIDGIDTFTSLGLSPTIAAHLLTKLHLKTPTAIQKAALSQMLKDSSDAFIQSETGSGKTLAYLLPLVQRIMTISEQIQAEQKEIKNANPLLLHRDSGLFAVILAPTRELCKQISVVLERLLGCARYIVAGHVLGGEKKKSEKARLRKGLNILVATPGRLVDHLENTKALDVSNVRWLVLDEGDRLMDLGFEEDITKIVKTLDQRKQDRETRGTIKWPGLPAKRTTVLCSATLKMNVQKLGEISLKDAILIKGDTGDDDQAENMAGMEKSSGNAPVESAFLAPAQLKQSYVVAAAKLRFVTLAALLKRTFARKGSVMKAIVFLSCADSVEFHFKAFTSALEDVENAGSKEVPKPSSSDTEDSDAEALQSDKPTVSLKPSKDRPLTETSAPSPTLSTKSNPLTLYKLHGSLPQPVRTATINAFTTTTAPSLLLATDVASRGLDLPNLDLVIEYDPAFSAEDHLHRIGRTARLGRDGRAVIFLLPGREEGYISVLKSSYKTGSDSMSSVSSLSADDVLKKGFSQSSGVVATKKMDTSQHWETRATDLQLSLERWVLSFEATKSLARKAFQSHIRAYATHTASERTFFDIKELHLGHLCKSFGLRETPGGIGAGRSAVKTRRGASGMEAGEKRKRGVEGEETRETDEAARKMREKVRLGRRKMMGGGGADEFNIA